MDRVSRQVLVPGEVARMFGVTPATLSRWIREGKFKPSFRTPSGQPRFYADQVKAYMEASREDR